jgi:hypothetical protein
VDIDLLCHNGWYISILGTCPLFAHLGSPITSMTSQKFMITTIGSAQRPR